MKRHLNNKGYMLVEIILAFVLAMTVAYFIMDLTIKLKNKNDDLLVKTLVYTDQAIIYNEIMEYLISLDASQYGAEPCNVIEENITLTNNKITINGFGHTITKYAEVEAISCNGYLYTPENQIIASVTIPVNVKQLPEEDFDIVIKYSRGIE